MDKSKIGLVTTVFNWELYERTHRFFPDGIKIYAIDGTKGFFGLNSLLFSIKKLRKNELDWLILADEDVIFSQPENVFDLIRYMDEHDFTACGIRDGGMIKWRNKNPFVINQFFTVLNLKNIFQEYNEQEIRKNQYVRQDEFYDDLNKLPFDYNVASLAEPYYCFYLWLRRKNKKILFLNGEVSIPDDFATTLLKDHLNQPILYHTWYARFYDKDNLHTERINHVLSLALGKASGSSSLRPILLKKPAFEAKVFIYTYWRRFLRIKNSFIGFL